LQSTQNFIPFLPFGACGAGKKVLEFIATGFPKVRPWYGHAEHFHVRIACPADSAECKSQPPPDPNDGCGPELDFWFKESTRHPRPPLIPPRPEPGLTLAGLPPVCKQIVKAP
jgi:penicillin-insensitive murein endopeptidase